MTKILENIADLFKVKSLITLSLTGVLIAMLVGAFNPSQEFVTLFCTAYGSIITYFFTKKEEPKPENVVETTIIRADEEEGVFHD